MEAGSMKKVLVVVAVVIIVLAVLARGDERNEHP